jgi:hypothetical protein
MLQGKMENLELKAENRALKENAEQTAKYQVYPIILAPYLKAQRNPKLTNVKIYWGFTFFSFI